MEKKYSTMNELKKGSFIIIDGDVCRVVSTTHSKPGKHGAPKVRLEATGVLDGKRRSMVSSADSRAEVPIIDKRNAQVISISGEKASVMDLENYETFDIDIPEEYKGKVMEGASIIYWDIGAKLIKGVK